MDANLRRRDVLALLAALGATGALEGAAQAADPRPSAPQAAGSMDASTGKEVFKNDKLRVVRIQTSAGEARWACAARVSIRIRRT